MKKTLLLLWLVTTIIGCKKSSNTVNVNDLFNPPQGSSAANLQTALVGTWLSTGNVTQIYYDVNNNILYQGSASFQQTYWIFYPASYSPPAPSILKSTTSLTSFGNDCAYTTEVDGSIDYLIRYSQNPGDGDKDLLVFTGTTKFQITFASVKVSNYVVNSVSNPSAEWDMDRPFNCKCGSEQCIGYIAGAKHLTKMQMANYRFTGFIKQKLAAV